MVSPFLAAMAPWIALSNPSHAKSVVNLSQWNSRMRPFSECIKAYSRQQTEYKNKWSQVADSYFGRPTGHVRHPHGCSPIMRLQVPILWFSRHIEDPISYLHWLHIIRHRPHCPPCDWHLQKRDSDLARFYTLRLQARVQGLWLHSEKKKETRLNDHDLT